MNAEELIQPEATAQDAGEAVIAPDRHWYVANVGQNREKSSRDKLLGLGYEAFVASQNELHYWNNGRRKMVDTVKITTKVFVHVTEQERRHIVNFPFIKSFMVNRAASLTPTGMHPLAIIPDHQMELLKFMLFKSEKPVHFVETPLAKGDRVRVIRGPLQGFEGEVVRLYGSDAQYVGVNIGFLGCALTEIPLDDVVRTLDLS